MRTQYSTITDTAMPILHQLRDLYSRAADAGRRFPMSGVQLMARVAVGMVFWRSGLTKLDSWQSTLQLFANEYRVPLLPTEIAAMLATTTELGCALLLFIGLLARPAALALIGLVGVIQIFVYPQSWPDHILWVSLLLLILAQGPGKLSVDALLGRLFSR